MPSAFGAGNNVQVRVCAFQEDHVVAMKVDRVAQCMRRLEFSVRTCEPNYLHDRCACAFLWICSEI